MKPEDLEPGKSYACKFKIKTYITEQGEPVCITDLAENTRELKTGSWVSWGVIARRDTANRLLEVEDQQTDRTWILNWDEVWDIDVAQYGKETTDD